MNISLSIVVIMIVGAVVYLFVGGREAFAERVGELGKIMFFVALLVLLWK